MKFIYITCNISLLESLVKTLDDNGFKDYQIIDKITAMPALGDPRMNTAIWPGYNACIFLQVRDSEKAQKVMDYLDNLNKQAFQDYELIYAYTFDVAQYLDVHSVHERERKTPQSDQ